MSKKKDTTNAIRKRAEADRKFKEKQDQYFAACFDKTGIRAKCWCCAEVIAKDLDGYVSEEELQPFAKYFKRFKRI